jgi:hypothetical protein
VDVRPVRSQAPLAGREPGAERLAHRWPAPTARPVSIIVCADSLPVATASADARFSDSTLGSVSASSISASVASRSSRFSISGTSARFRALADGGELRWIEDPELIGRIARAYHRIESTTTLERAIFDFENDPTRKTIHYREGSESPLVELHRWVTDQDEHTIAAIDHAVDGIDRARTEGD